ncbi:MAG: GGDEF domain-containing protein [Bacillota bacterium]|nr:GGDEF domain-containing protein [Bacillota bacterium]
MREALLKANISRAFYILITIMIVEIFMLIVFFTKLAPIITPSLRKFYIFFYVILIVVSGITSLVYNRYRKKPALDLPDQRLLSFTIYAICFFLQVWGVGITFLDIFNGYGQIIAFAINFIIAGILFIHPPLQWLIVSLPPMVFLCFGLHFIKTEQTSGNILTGNIVNLIILYVCIFVSVHLTYRSFKNSENYKRRIEVISVTDMLTGLYNRTGLYQYIQEKLPDFNNCPIGVLFIDIDYFKEYNDFYGHVKGDECLQKIGMHFNGFAEKHNGVAMRFGGEEFVVILPDHDEASVSRLANELRTDIERLNISHERSAIADHLTISIGQYCDTLHLDDETDFMRYLDKADAAVYEAKRAGRNKVFIFQGEK